MKSAQTALGRAKKVDKTVDKILITCYNFPEIKSHTYYYYFSGGNQDG